ncbi:unnamed protein product [Aureobasidium pullulans]|nr:unnamed protein product [Aureobasidium pullulans]
MQVMSSPPVRHLPLCSLFRSTIPIFVVNLADVTHIFHACAPSRENSHLSLVILCTTSVLNRSLFCPQTESGLTLASRSKRPFDE